MDYRTIKIDAGAVGRGAKPFTRYMLYLTILSLMLDKQRTRTCLPTWLLRRCSEKLAELPNVAACRLSPS